jgi:hypothetical protein
MQQSTTDAAQCRCPTLLVSHLHPRHHSVTPIVRRTPQTPHTHTTHIVTSTTTENTPLEPWRAIVRTMFCRQPRSLPSTPTHGARSRLWVMTTLRTCCLHFTPSQIYLSILKRVYRVCLCAGDTPREVALQGRKLGESEPMAAPLCPPVLTRRVVYRSGQADEATPTPECQRVPATHARDTHSFVRRLREVSAMHQTWGSG